MVAGGVRLPARARKAGGTSPQPDGEDSAMTTTMNTFTKAMLHKEE